MYKIYIYKYRHIHACESSTFPTDSAIKDTIKTQWVTAREASCILSRKTVHSTMLPPPCLTVGMLLFGSYSGEMLPKSSVLVSDHSSPESIRC